MVVARQQEWERPAAVAERDTEVRTRFGGTARDHRRDGEARVGRVTHGIEQRLGREPVHHRRPERVDEDRDREPFRFLEERLELGHAERFAVHVRAELDPGEPQRRDAGQFLRRESGILQRHDPEAEEAARRRLAHADHGLVRVPAEVERFLRCEPVGAELGHRRDHLGVDAVTLHVAQAPLDVPVALVDGAVVLALDHHARAAWFEVIHRRPRPGAGARAGRREVLRNDVGVHVDHHRACSPLAPRRFVS